MCVFVFLCWFRLFLPVPPTMLQHEWIRQITEEHLCYIDANYVVLAYPFHFSCRGSLSYAIDYRLVKE